MFWLVLLEVFSLLCILGLSHKGTLNTPTNFVTGKIPVDCPIVLVFGAMASGSIDINDHPYVSLHCSYLNYFMFRCKNW